MLLCVNNLLQKYGADVSYFLQKIEERITFMLHSCYRLQFRATYQELLVIV